MSNPRWTPEAPGRHEFTAMRPGSPWCRLCVLPADHETHAGALVLDLAAARRNRTPPV